MSEEQVDPEVTKLAIIKSQAVRQAMVEVLGECRVDIIKRARAKLTALGIDLSNEEAEL